MLHNPGIQDIFILTLNNSLSVEKSVFDRKYSEKQIVLVLRTERRKGNYRLFDALEGDSWKPSESISQYSE